MIKGTLRQFALHLGIKPSENVLNTTCQFCGKKPSFIIDAPTDVGPWAHMCVGCYRIHRSLGSARVATAHHNGNQEDLDVGG